MPPPPTPEVERLLISTPFEGGLIETGGRAYLRGGGAYLI